MSSISAGQKVSLSCTHVLTLVWLRVHLALLPTEAPSACNRHRTVAATLGRMPLAFIPQVSVPVRQLLQACRASHPAAFRDTWRHRRVVIVTLRSGEGERRTASGEGLAVSGSRTISSLRTNCVCKSISDLADRPLSGGPEFKDRLSDEAIGQHHQLESSLMYIGDRHDIAEWHCQADQAGFALPRWIRRPPQSSSILMKSSRSFVKRACGSGMSRPAGPATSVEGSSHSRLRAIMMA